MTDFPTVGLGVDLSGIDAGDKAYTKLQKTIEGVGQAADNTGRKVQAAAVSTKAASESSAKAETARAAASTKAAADETKAAVAAAKEQERVRRYLQQVRITSIQMEEAARRAAQADEMREAAQRAATLAAADRAATAEAERNAKYLLQVRLNSFKMQETAAQKAAIVQIAADNAAYDARVAAAKRAAQAMAIANAAPSSTAQMAAQVRAQEEADLAAARAANISTVARNASATSMRSASTAATSLVSGLDKIALAYAAEMKISEAEARATLNATAAFRGMFPALKATEAASRDAAIAVGATGAAITGTSIKVREAIVLFREFLRGDFTRMAGSATILFNAFQAITGELLAMAVLIAALAAPFVAMAFAALKGQQEISKFNGALIATGNYAGLTVTKMEELSATIAKNSDTTIGSSKKSVEALAETGKFTAASIASLADAAQNYSRITHESADKYIKEYEGMKDHLVQFAVKHEDVYHDLTLQQIEQINWLVKHGREAEAQELLAADIDAASKKRREEAVAQQTEQFGSLQRWVHQLTIDASAMWDALMGLGRPKTLGQQIDAAQAQVFNDMRAASNTGGFGGRGATGSESSVVAARSAKLQQDIGVLNALNAQQAAEKAKVAQDAADAKKRHDEIQGKFGDGKSRGRTPTDDNATAIDTAQKAQLVAEQALTKNVEEVAKFKAAEAAAEYRLQVDRLKKEVAAKHITSDTMRIADAAYSEALLAKLLLIEREKRFGIEKRTLAQAEALQADAQAIASIQAGQAKTAADAAAIEDKALQSKQELDAKAYILATKQLVFDGEITADMGKERILSRLGLQIIQKEQQIEKDRLAKIAERAQIENDWLALVIDALTSQRDATTFVFKQREIDLHILALKQEQERLALERIVEDNKSDAAVRAAQERLLANIDINKNQVRTLTGGPEGTFKTLTETLDKVTTAFKGHDWTSLVHNLIDVFGQLRAAFSRAASAGDKLAAAAAVASTVGNAIGGTAGSTISGAANGAMAGYTLGGPIGAVIGAVLGGIGGYNSAKKAQEQAKAQAAAEAAAKAEAIATAHRQLEIQVMILSGDTIGALAAQRKDELAAADASNRALMQQVYDLQDVAAAQDRLNQKTALEIKLMTAQGNAAGALAAQRKLDLAAMDASLRPLQVAINATEDLTTAQNNLQTAYQAQAAEIQSTITKFQAFVDNLKAFKKQLTTGPLAALSPQDQYLKTQALFRSTQSAALGGDPQALQDLQSVSEAYLQASKDYYASTEPYFKDLAEVKAGVDAAEAVAQAQVDMAQQQLDALNNMVDGLITINTSVLSVVDAVKAVQDAILAQAAALAAVQAAAVTPPATTPPANDNFTPGSTIDYNQLLAARPDVLAQYNHLIAIADRNSPWFTQHGLDQGPTGFAAWWYNQGGGSAEYAPSALATASNLDTSASLDLGSGVGASSAMPLATVATSTASSSIGSGGGQAVLDALADLTSQVMQSNVLAQAGHSGTIDKLDDLVGETADLRATVRAQAA